ncbi:hypothetical protein [uncultured Flavonifractor sp.]|uniref:hypothetical protein n=1 Tax=uncultured Flavonifractor sp. TaxID=1193534 RepID=UPI002622E021|nr:hypothetical protein [uncultured Flavonifractor sp.]
MCYDNVDWISRVRFIVRPMPHNSVKTANFSYFVGPALAKAEFYLSRHALAAGEAGRYGKRPQVIPSKTPMEGEDTMKKFRLLLAAGLLLLLTGCFSQSVEELYAPPRAPDDYLKLDNKINEVLNEGGEYAAPLTGEYTQKVQLQDLDGDGVQEAIAFFRVSSSERPLKIYVYRQTGDNYEVAAIIEGEGSAINYVAYENLDNSPSKEIIVSWQMMSDQNHSLAAYSINNDHVLELMRTSYTNFQICDIDQDSQGEIVVVQTGVTEESNRVELYNYQDGMMELNSSAPLSRNVTGLPDGGVKTGYLQDNIPAVFVSSTYGRSGTAQNYTDISYSESGQITDIFAWKGGRIQNITLDPDTGESDNTIRWYTAVTAKDINNDGILELPDPYALPDPNSTSVAVNFWAIRWRQYDIDGKPHLVFTTYYNDRDGWYFILPDDWDGKITITRSDVAGGGERAVIFSYWTGSADVDPAPFLVIYTLSGDNRFMRANMSGRFRLLEGNDDSDTIYAARFIQTDWDCGLDESGVKAHFALITNDWS